MKKKDKNYYNFLVIFFLIIFFIQKSLASESLNFLSLKNNEVNVRVGPSKEYPIKFIYKKKYLPLEVLDKSETWRKIKDFENNSVLYKKPTIFSKPIAKLETGRLMLIKKCKVKWCKITSGDYEGWIFKNVLWGNIN